MINLHLEGLHLQASFPGFGTLMPDDKQMSHLTHFGEVSGGCFSLFYLWRYCVSCRLHWGSRITVNILSTLLRRVIREARVSKCYMEEGPLYSDIWNLLPDPKFREHSFLHWPSVMPAYPGGAHSHSEGEIWGLPLSCSASCSMGSASYELFLAA